jgi:hypothetical protein
VSFVPRRQTSRLAALLRGFPAVLVLLILSGTALTACRLVPQSYYDWLDAGGGYYNGYGSLFEGGFINECRLRDAGHPRACRIESGRIGSSGFGAFGHPLSSGRMSGMTGSSPGRLGGGRTAGGANVGGQTAHGGGAGGGHGGHGGR